MNQKIKTLNIVAIALLVLQLFSYLGNSINKVEYASKAEAIGGLCGENIFLIIALILFARTYSLKRKLRRPNYKDQPRMNDPHQRDKYLK